MSSDLIEGYNSLPVRPAYCRLWRFVASLWFAFFVLTLAVIIAYILLVNGWIPFVPKIDVLSALASVALDVIQYGVIIYIAGFIVSYFFIARGLYDWLYDGR